MAKVSTYATATTPTTSEYLYLIQGGVSKKITLASLLATTLSFGGLAGAESLKATALASAVNRVNVTGALTTNNCVISVEGSDTNPGLVVMTKGSGALFVCTGGSSSEVQAKFSQTANAVNFWELTGAAAGNGVSLYLSGASTNISAYLATKGNGQWCFATGGTTGEIQARVSQVVNAVNYLEFKGGTTGNGVTIATNGSDSGSDLFFDCKGAGRVRSLDGITSSHATNGVGYETGAGGTVTQATSKATGVTLNKVCGTITLNGAALASATVVSFVLTNSAIAAGDNLIVNHDSVGTLGGYMLNARCAAGSATIDVRNVTGGSLSEAIVLKFTLIKAVTA